jgi:hypothetical protein
MSYGSARTLALSAKASKPEEAIQYLADAIRELSTAVEQDIAKIDRVVRLFS